MVGGVEESAGRERGATVVHRGHSYHELMIGGMGGRGVLMAGQLLVEAGASTYEHVLMFPNYSGAMRGTDSECTVILSHHEIWSPVVLHPQAVMVMSRALRGPFEERLTSGGAVLVDSTLVDGEASRSDVETFYIPATRVAQGLGSALAANLVLLGAYVELTGVFPIEYLEGAVERMMVGGRRESLLTTNLKALREGARLMAKYHG